MTLKQFFKAAAGIIIAILINASGIIFFIKWPLMLLFGAGGLLLAFVPYEDRPLETWLMAFLRSTYSPTIFVYSKKKLTSTVPKQAEEVVAKGPEEAEKEEISKKKDEKKVREFITSLPSVKREKEEEVKKKVVEKVKEDEIVKEVEKQEVKQELAAKSNNEEWRDQRKDLNIQRRRLEATGVASFGSIPMPDIPDVPNVLVGMVTDLDGKIIEGAIVEIQDDIGNPSRVLKTNALGQFRVSTPLANGKYLIISEKEGFSFDRVNIELKGEIVKPIKIISK